MFASWQHRPCDKGEGKTSVIEGLNNKWRNRVSGLVRKTVRVRYLDDLQRRLWLVTEGHNQLRLKQIEQMLKASTLKIQYRKVAVGDAVEVPFMFG